MHHERELRVLESRLRACHRAGALQLQADARDHLLDTRRVLVAVPHAPSLAIDGLRPLLRLHGHGPASAPSGIRDLHLVGAGSRRRNSSDDINDTRLTAGPDRVLSRLEPTRAGPVGRRQPLTDSQVVGRHSAAGRRVATGLRVAVLLLQRPPPQLPPLRVLSLVLALQLRRSVRAIRMGVRSTPLLASRVG